MYARVAKFIEDKAKLAEDKIPELTDLVGDEDKAKEIVEAAKASMGKYVYVLRKSLSVSVSTSVLVWFELIQVC